MQSLYSHPEKAGIKFEGRASDIAENAFPCEICKKVIIPKEKFYLDVFTYWDDTFPAYDPDEPVTRSLGFCRFCKECAGV